MSSLLNALDQLICDESYRRIIEERDRLQFRKVFEVAYAGSFELTGQDVNFFALSGQLQNPAKNSEGDLKSVDLYSDAKPPIALLPPPDPASE